MVFRKHNVALPPPVREFNWDACVECRQSFDYYGLRKIGSTRLCGECYGNHHKPYVLQRLAEAGDPCGSWTLWRVEPYQGTLRTRGPSAQARDPRVAGKHIRLHNVAYWECYFPDLNPKAAAEYRPMRPFSNFSQVRGLYIPVAGSEKLLPFPLKGPVERGLYHENGNDAQIAFERQGQVYFFRAGY